MLARLVLLAAAMLLCAPYAQEFPAMKVE